MNTSTISPCRLALLLQVYYLYRRPMHAQSTMPTFVGAFRLLRLICLRESINLVHCHQAFSSLGGEALLQARTMGYKVSFALGGCKGTAVEVAVLVLPPGLKCPLPYLPS